MGLLSAGLTGIFLGLLLPVTLLAQSSQSSQLSTSISIPRLISINGVFTPADGRPPGREVVTLAIYAEETGGEPLWHETQTIDVDRSGRYTVLFGETQADGVPLDVFASGEARWLGVAWARPGEVEGSRMRLTSVPYALRASDADTLGGRPASAYLLSPPPTGEGATTTATTPTDAAVSLQAVLPGTTNFLAKYVNGSDVGNSAVYEAGGFLGVNTPAPLDVVHSRFTNTNGGLTGYAVQNLGNTASSYSGMLFYDHNGALGQFQGFNNTNHEYRINNIATSPAGSINFMIGSSSKFFVSGLGNIGIGTTAPSSVLDVTNAASTAASANITATTYAASAAGSQFIGSKARGTAAGPTAAQSGDTLAFFGARGYGTTAFGGTRGAMIIRAAENWTDAAQGTSIAFNTTLNGTAGPLARMNIDTFGNVGIGTPAPFGALEVSRSGSDTVVFATTYGGEPGFLTRAARGTSAAPTAVQDGDQLGLFGAGGFAATGFTDVRVGFAGFAAENWTDAAQGTGMVLATTPIGAVDAVVQMGILPNGNVGIGTPPGPDGEPTALDRLQVFGDIRVGTSGINGCLKNFTGTPLAGVCASDARFKKHVTPFNPALGSLVALQPVHYHWRAAEFPDRHFGDSRAYGLVAQDVEKVLPELVVTNDDGYKAVDYSKLPLLTIQAVKELKAENDALKDRVAELERVINELVVTTRPR